MGIKSPKREIVRRNPIHADLISGKYRKRIEVKRKGMASYRRPNNRRPDASRDGGFDSRARTGLLTRLR